MDKLHESLLLEILSRLDDSSDAARCRVASKAFDAVFPCLRSINLRCTRFCNSWSRDPDPYLSEILLELILKLETVESVSIAGIPYSFFSFRYFDKDFVKAWLPRVSGSLKSLSMSDLPTRRHNLQHLNLRLNLLYLSPRNLNPMPMLTSLTLEGIDFGYEYLHELDKCFPNLQVLNLVNVKHPSYLTVITPNLITLKIDCCEPVANIHVDAPKLTHFHLSISTLKHAKIEKFESLKTLLLDSFYIDSLLSEFPIIETVETLTLKTFSKLTIAKAFTAFPNVSSLCIGSISLSQTEGWEILDGMKGLKTLCAYLRVVDVLTFFNVACVLDQCVGLSELLNIYNVIYCCLINSTFKKKAPKAIKEIRKFAQKAMGTTDVRVDVKLNKHVWSRGIRSVPRRVRVRIARKRNDDEDAKEELYSLVTVAEIPAEGLKGLGTKIIDDED
ncbi:F-box/LRR-repeat protein At4g29420-like [Bidens hawaiensis]|uniref:F-box/LRR-repeat protein At4g29420-like n=1 Tax=Bidens hawaiensis TaxID=980011 RepID=UPI00404A8369